MSNPVFSIARALSAAIFLAAATAAHAEIYRWVNEDGTTTYSNIPPEDKTTVQDFTLIETPRAPSAPPAPPQITIEPTPPPKIVIEPSAPRPESEAPRARRSVRSMLPQAVQDPCLTSWDPLCHEKNKGRYKPYVGYMPHESSTVADNTPVVPPARGATNGASGGGTVAGGTRPR